jgi:parallel beta-helix repeat protein
MIQPGAGSSTHHLREVTNNRAKDGKSAEACFAPKPPGTGRTTQPGAIVSGGPIARSGSSELRREAVLDSAVAASATPSVLQVPSPQFPTLQSAIDNAASANKTSIDASNRVTKIIVAGGTVVEVPVSLTCEGVEVVGLNPKPIIVVPEPFAAVTIDSQSGSFVNFEVRQTRAERRGGEARPVGIDIRRGQWRIAACDIYSTAGSCTFIATGADPTIADCLLARAGQAGIYSSDDSKGTYQRNTIADCAYAGVLAKKGACGLFTDNSIRGGLETGIFCHDCKGIFERNVVTDNSGCGFVIKGLSASPNIRSNCITGNKQAGLFCCDGSKPSVSDNEIRGNGKAGILIKSDSAPIVLRNVISESRETGIYVFENGSGQIEDNEILANCNAGILVTTGGNPAVRHNVIQRNMYEGVWVCKKGRGSFSQNDLRFNRKGPKDVELSSSVQWLANVEN